MTEYIGYKDATGDGLCNMGLTEEEVIRCRDCEHFDDGICGFWEWGGTSVEPDGYCAWAVRRSCADGDYAKTLPKATRAASRARAAHPQARTGKREQHPGRPSKNR